MHKYLSKKEEKELERTNPENYQKYYNYARLLYESSFIANLTLEQRKKLYPLLYKILKIMNFINKNKLILIGDDRIKSNKPKIYAVTHIGKYDIEMICEAIKEHTYILSGDFENLHNTISGTFLETNGIIYVNEKSKTDRQNTKQEMIRILKNHGNILYFPEGTWNLTASSPMLKLYPGIITVASKGNAEIVPVAIEQYDRTFIAKIGKNIDPNQLLENGLSQKDVLQYLRDLMATLKWEIYESIPKWDYKSIPQNYHENYLKERMAEWPGFTYDEVLSKVFKEENETSPEEAFLHLKKININKNNAFLLRK